MTNLCAQTTIFTKKNCLNSETSPGEINRRFERVRIYKTYLIINNPARAKISETLPT